MPEPRVKLLLIVTHPYLAMLDACAVITALMKRPENNLQLTYLCSNTYDDVTDFNPDIWRMKHYFFLQIKKINYASRATLW